jgi:RNA polymerase sigma factor (sigma-70 family)
MVDANQAMPNILLGLPEHPMTVEDENNCAVFIQRTRDEDKINQLVMSVMRDAILYAGRCARGRIPPGELFSLCYSALCKAAPRFYPGGIRFFAYAKQDVRGEISRYWKSLDVVKSASAHEDKTTAPIFKVKVYNDAERDTEDVMCEIPDEALTPTLIEPEFDLINIRERWAIVAPLLHKHLTERERMVLSLFYESGFSFEQICKMVVPTVSRSAIQHAHGCALRKIRNALSREKKLYTI